MDGSASGWDDPLGGFGRAALLLAGGMGLVVLLPLLALVVVVGGVKGTDRARDSPTIAGVIGEIPPDQFSVMQTVARETGIPWQVFAAIAKVESDFGRNMATSSAGAIGYGQFLPATWAGFGRGGDPYNA